ncbi:MAG TPA: amidohydrolase family protein [Candidatus Aquicultor sp.]|jgi:5-methylthioadenosine/S-adenosylhomocysteine deaminase
MIYTSDIVLPITQNPIRKGAVLVENGLIAAVGERESLLQAHPDEKIKDFGCSILMPGLVNLHGHLECSLFEGLAQPTQFISWLEGIIQAGRRLDQAGWVEAARLGVRKYFEAGITCTADITRSGAGVLAMAEVKMPGIVYMEAVAIDNSNLADAVVDILGQLKSAEMMVQTDTFAIGLSPHSPYTLSEPALKACIEIASTGNLPVTTHLAETQAECELLQNGSGELAVLMGKRLKIDAIERGGYDTTPARYLDRLGVLQPGLIAAHGVWLTAEDLGLLKEKGVCIAACPTSNELLGTGKASISQFFEQGLEFGIGTDSAASNPQLDLFDEARKMYRLYKEQTGGDERLTAQHIIHKLTINAAQALGLADKLGSIEPGKRADFIGVDCAGAVNAGNDVYAFILEHTSKAQVNNTVLGGNLVYTRS